MNTRRANGTLHRTGSDGAEPNRTEPGLTEPDRIEPNRTLQLNETCSTLIPLNVS